MISVVMATYNGSKYIREQLDSIYCQTLPPDEVIVVDDCSTDDTCKILEEFKCNFGLKYFVNKKRLGVNGNFERGLELANGDYILISDQDDVWIQQKIEVEYNKIKEIENGEPACVSCQVKEVDKNLQPKNNKASILKESNYERALVFNSSQGCTLIINKALKELVLPLNNYFIYDHFIGVYACFVGNRFVIDKPLMLYRHHGNNVLASSIVNYHPYISEGINLYYIMKCKERLYLLEDLKKRYLSNINIEKQALLESTISFFLFENDFGLIKNVFCSRLLHPLIKLYCILYCVVTWFVPKRRGAAMSNPVTL